MGQGRDKALLEGGWKLGEVFLGLFLDLHIDLLYRIGRRD